MSFPENKYLFSVFALMIFCHPVFANEAVDSFIEEVKTVTYDCPAPENFEQLERYLEDDSITESQRFSLSVAKSHFLICNGKTEEAQSLLFQITGKQDLDTSTYFYASAIYQIGFTYDLQESPKRCFHYERAKELSADSHPDVYLSASLGIITNCLEHLETGERLGMMFSILQRYSATSDYRALAHIHNSIGLIYGGLDQHVLAAEQYLKAHEMGLRVYTGSNQLTILVSAITALFASGQFDKAYEAIVEFEELNQNVGTPLTNYFYNHALAGYHYRTGNIDEMKSVLPALAETASELSNPFIDAVVKWYQVVPCVYEYNKACIENYLTSLQQREAGGQNYFSSNTDYLQLKVQMYLVLNDSEKMQLAFEEYASRVNDRRENRQYSASILGVANLYSKIHSLESEVAQAERVKRNTLLTTLSAFFAVVAFIGFILHKKHQARMAIDPSTELLNSKTALTNIAKVGKPDKGKTNALAIFDLGNFREINRMVGATKGDYVLHQIAQTLKNVTRDSDILGRFAPEQFILCLPNIEERIAKNFFERVQKELDNTFKADNEAANISVRSSMSIFITNEKLTDLKAVLDEMLLSISIQSRA